MADIREIGHRAGVIGLGRSLYVASLFILNIILARSLGTELFGSFQQVFLFNTVFLIVTLGIPETLYYFLPRLKDEERPAFLTQTILILAVTGAAAALVFRYWAPQLAGVQHNPAIIGDLRIFGWYGAFIIASSFADPVFITFGRLRYAFGLTALHAAFFVGLAVWQRVDGVSIAALFTVMGVFAFLKYLVSLGLLFRLSPQFGGLSFTGKRPALLLQLSFALPVALTSAIDLVSRWLDKFVVSVFFGSETLGIFSIGAMEIPFLSVIVASVYSVATPLLSGFHHRGEAVPFASLVRQTISFSARIIWPVAIYLFVFADHLVPLVVGREYLAAVAPFRVYLTVLPIRLALYGAIVLAMGRSRTVFWCAYAALAVNAALSVFLASTIGMIGPAVATVASTYVHVAVLLVIIVRELNIPLAEIVPFHFLFTVGTACGLAVLAAYGFTWRFTDHARAVEYSLPIFFGAYYFLGARAQFLKIADIRDLFRGMARG